MVWVAGGLEIGRVAGVAVSRQRLKTARCSSLVTGVAIHRRMRARQGKAIVVLLHLADGDLPSPNCMALLAVRPQLALMDVGMAILTPLSNVGKYGPDVTFGARDGRMHTP